jgi:hypothetical protein
MSKITGKLEIRKEDDTHWFILRLIKFLLNDGRLVTIKRGFVFDGGSVPQALWAFVPPMGTAADWGFALHDALYSWHRDSSQLVIVSDSFTRKDADLAMMEVHLHAGVSQELAELIYTGVRLGASRSWMTPEEKLASNIIKELPEYYDQ